MKAAINIARIVVGLLFIFSGLIKANDPLGLSYKMQEFFELWGMDRFNSWTLLSSVLMNAFEIIAGFALLLGWRINLFSWLLLLLILFFTFLTGYTYVTGKPTNCGCFGDCIPITAKTSFLKDAALTLLIGFLFWQRKKIKPLFSGRITTLSMLGITILSFGFQWYTLTYLPLIDCLPFKKGNIISEQMKKPANAIPDSTVIIFVYEKEGKEIEFTADKFPADFNDSIYKFKDRRDDVVRKGKNNEAPIKSFVLSGADKNIDSAAIILAQPYAILLFCEDFSVPISKWEGSFAKIYAAAKEKSIPVYAITAVRDDAIKAFSKTTFSDMQVFSCDNITVRTAARTIIDKQSYKRMDKITSAVKSLPVLTPNNQ
jgi:uncharacterized membrane protein YphA (DoxX/SURF4 family)